MKKNDRGYKIKTSLSFKTGKEEKGKKRVTLGFFILIGIVMLACVCTLLLLKEYDFDIDNIIGRTPETTEGSTQAELETVLEGKATFLVAASSDNGDQLRHAALVSADVADGEIRIYTLDINKKYDEDCLHGSLASAFEKSDASMLSFKDTVSKITGAEISRYIRATDSSFKSLVKTFGGIPYNIRDSVKYSCDGVGYIIESGNQTLTADMSYKYLYYLSKENTDEPEQMSDFLAAVLKVILTQRNFEKADSYYNKLRNILDTDISAYDFSSSKTSLQQFVTLFEEKDVIIVDNADML